MRRFSRCICILLAMSLILAVPAFAAEEIGTRASSYFTKSSEYLCNISATAFDAWFNVTGTGTMDEIGANFIKIQRSEDGINWTTVRTFTKESYPSLIDTNSTAHAAGVRYVGYLGYYYRAYIQLYAKQGNNTATMDRVTSAIYFPSN